jgi:hypothetical protein
MAKKVVATLKSKEKAVSMSKIIFAYKNPKTGAYSFKEEMVLSEDAPKIIQERLKNL